MSLLKHALIGSALFLTAAAPAFAQDSMVKDSMTEHSMMKDDMAKDAMMKDAMMKDEMAASMTVSTSPLQRRNKTLRGAVSVVKENGQTILRFSEDFKASNGPDLKIFLSPKAVGDVTGATATNGALKLGFLTTNKGSHDVVIPAGVNLANYGSVLIHCEQFSVLWGGADI
jgi:pentapeptide MXKDX repeat protein